MPPLSNPKISCEIILIIEPDIGMIAISQYSQYSASSVNVDSNHNVNFKFIINTFVEY
jgi:hypothetical protein